MSLTRTMVGMRTSLLLSQRGSPESGFESPENETTLSYVRLMLLTRTRVISQDGGKDAWNPDFWALAL